MKRCKRTLALFLLPVLLCFECRDYAEPAAKAEPDWRSAVGPDLIEGIRLASAKSPMLFAQFRSYQKVKPGGAFEFGIEEGRKLIIDPSELKAFDHFTSDPKFKDLQSYVQKTISEIDATSNGKKGDYWQEGEDFYLSANVKGRIGELYGELKYLIETAPSTWTNSELIFVCNSEINEFGNDVTYLSPELTAEERAEILAAVETVYQNLPGIINANRGMEESRTKGLLGSIVGSWILHVAIMTAAVVAIALVIGVIVIGPAAIAAAIATQATVSLGVLGTYTFVSATVWAGVSVGTAVAAAMAGINECLDQAGGLHYAPCDT